MAKPNKKADQWHPFTKLHYVETISRQQYRRRLFQAALLDLKSSYLRLNGETRSDIREMARHRAKFAWRVSRGLEVGSE